MRLKTLALAALAMLGAAAPAKAGLFEIFWDPITRHHNCSVEPCRDNGLHYKQVWMRDRYLRFDIHTQPAEYEMRRVQVMVSPPGIEFAHGVHQYDRWGDANSLVSLPAPGPYQVVRAPRYQWVTTPVLVHPATAWVTRRKPYYAYYPETIVVQGGCGSDWACRTDH